jgi:hypothetical protein
VIVVDDHTLLAVLIGRANATQAPIHDEEVYTTASWWYRLARAVQDPQFTGALSSKLAALQPDIRHVVVESLEELPAEIGVLPPRVLVPVMAALSRVGRFNHLHADALATAIVLPARLRVVAASELLRSACSTLRVDLAVAPI